MNKIMYYTIWFVLIVFLFSITSCNWSEVKEIIRIRVINNTFETISVETGKDYIEVEVKSKTNLDISVVKDESLLARGLKSGNLYRSQSFHYENQIWTIP